MRLVDVESGGEVGVEEFGDCVVPVGLDCAGEDEEGAGGRGGGEEVGFGMGDESEAVGGDGWWPL